MNVFTKFKLDILELLPDETILNWPHSIYELFLKEVMLTALLTFKVNLSPSSLPSISITSPSWTLSLNCPSVTYVSNVVAFNVIIWFDDFTLFPTWLLTIFFLFELVISIDISEYVSSISRFSSVLSLVCCILSVSCCVTVVSAVEVSCVISAVAVVMLSVVSVADTAVTHNNSTTSKTKKPIYFFVIYCLLKL